MGSEMCIRDSFWLLSKSHKELLWALYSLIGLDMPTQFSYLKFSSSAASSKFEKFLLQVFPHMSTDDIAVLNLSMTRKEKEELLLNHGYDKKQVKDVL